eukprot:4539934-Pleurochrysis_carterae.AAC.1
MICPDPLHAYLNVIDAVFSYGILDRIVIVPGDSAELQDVKSEACLLINAASHTHRVQLTFSTDKKDPMPKINRNVWKEMTKPALFPAVLDALHCVHECQTPLWADSSKPYTPATAATATAATHSANSDSDNAATAAASARPTPKRFPFKPPAEQAQPEPPARRQKKSGPVTSFRQRMDAEAE